MFLIPSSVAVVVSDELHASGEGKERRPTFTPDVQGMHFGPSRVLVDSLQTGIIRHDSRGWTTFNKHDWRKTTKAGPQIAQRLEQEFTFQEQLLELHMMGFFSIVLFLSRCECWCTNVRLLTKQG